MSEDNEKTQQVHDETASQSSEHKQEGFQALASATGGTQSSGPAPEGDGGFAENRKFIDQAHEAIDRAFDALEHALYVARCEAKAQVVDDVFPIVRGIRARRKAKQHRA